MVTSVRLKLTCIQNGVPLSKGTPFLFYILLKGFAYMHEFSITRACQVICVI